MARIATLTTPEQKVFKFKIPKGARADYRGFYRIDKTWHAENPDIDWGYLRHDLEHRGLNKDNDVYEANGIQLKMPKYQVTHLRGPIAKKSDDWNETADAWLFIINCMTFEYCTGIGCRVNDRPITPDIESLLYSLTMDSDACDYSFDEWCDNFGYNTDSRKALETFLACQENAKKLAKLGFKLHELREYFQTIKAIL